MAIIWTTLSWYRVDRQGIKGFGQLNALVGSMLRLFCANNDNGILRINVWKGTMTIYQLSNIDRKKVDIIFSGNCELPDVEEFIFWNLLSQ